MSRSLHIEETHLKQDTGKFGCVEVALIRWPVEADKRSALLASQQPHLLLVEFGPPPVNDSPFEDWIRVPASAADLEARLESLRSRSRQLETDDGTWTLFGLRLEEGGILRTDIGWVSLSPLEARLVATLLERPGAAVTRQALIESGWPPTDEARTDPRRHALDAHMLRLRQRLPSVGLTVRTIRSRGYLLEQLPLPPSWDRSESHSSSSVAGLIGPVSSSEDDLEPVPDQLESDDQEQDRHDR
jgi:DNA-binding winged helix-turn-helix (wHTH) protein